MKEIIVAIDFSKGSLRALQYAIHFANKAKCNVMMVYIESHSGQDVAFSPESGEMRDELLRNFEELVASVRADLTGGKLTYKIRKGKVYQELAAQARLNKADLIISGTHGVSGFEEFWIGSNAFRIVSCAPCPVITVRSSYNVTRLINNIVIPIDHTADTLQKLPLAATLAKLFNAQIHILALHSSRLKSLQTKIETTVVKVEKYLSNCGVAFNSEFRFAENLTNTTLEFATEADADLIIIMTEQESSDANILLGQFAQQMVNFSPVPIMSVQPKEVFVLA
ncbi:MAG TPA: universal stress protein [Bacteroidales bacterium]